MLTVGSTSPWDCQSTGASAFNVKTGYKAAGDGSTNDTTAITNAINAAGVYASNSSHPFATVYFPAGTYMVTTGFQPPSNVCFMGAGTSNWQNQGAGTASPAASILRLSATVAACGSSLNPPQAPGNLIIANEGGGGSNNVEFTNMVLDSNGNVPCADATNTMGTDIHFQYSQNVKFDGIVVNGMGRTGNGYGFDTFDFANGYNYYLTNSTVIGAGVLNGGAQIFMSNNLFRLRITAV